MKRSIFTKLFFGQLIIIVSLSFFIFSFSVSMVRDFYIETLKKDLEKMARIFSLQVSPFLDEERYSDLDVFVKETGRDISVRITVIDETGNVLADSEKDPQKMENHRLRSEVRQAVQETIGTSIRHSSTVEEDMLYLAYPFNSKKGRTGVLRLSLFLKNIHSFLKGLKKNILQIFILMVILSILASIYLSRSFSQPLKKLGIASREIASGNFDVNLIIESKDEVGELAMSFNYMIDKIKTLFTEVFQQKEELGSIISSIQEGLCVLDKSGKIILSNESFRKMVKNIQVNEKFYWEIIRKPAFGNLIKFVMQNKKNSVEEIDLYSNIYMCSTTYLPLQDNITVIFFDLTELRKLEKMKKEFVLNVSHELRTPLTAIKGFVETLQDEAKKENRQYVGIIKKHTDRLINIVEDLLILAKIEEKDTMLELEQVDVNTALHNVLILFEQRAKSKGLDLKLNTSKDLPAVMADPFKLEQVFINIIDNAVKYTEKGLVTITVGKKDRNLCVEIKDTGIGISEEDLPRIFERFYVVDKSRSRRLGGTGLGLSIVKHIILLHRGMIKVDSTPGVGTTFRVSLPMRFPHI